MKGVDIDDPIMKEFKDNIDLINGIAEESQGFVWRLKDDSNNATAINPYNDEQIIVNVSVWETIRHLEEYTFKTLHADFLRRRKEWFQKFGQASYALWWVAAGQFPTVEECKARLDYLQTNGPSSYAFDFKKRFEPV